MKYKLADLIDIPQLQELMDIFYKVAEAPTAVLEAEGTVLTSTAWQPICTQFHRVCPALAERCTESDVYIADHLDEGKPYVAYECANGLVDVAAPIIVEGEHIGTVFTGQFLFEEPDVERFRQQAREFDLDEEAYLEALAEVPIVSREQLEPLLTYLSSFAEMLAGVGLQRLQQLETQQRVAESEARYQALAERYGLTIQQTGQLIYDYDIETGEIQWFGAIEELTGYTPEEFADIDIDAWAEHIHPEDRDHALATLDEATEQAKAYRVTYRFQRKDGTYFYVEDNGGFLVDDDGQAYRMLGAQSDITERRQAQTELERLGLAMEQTADGIAITDLDGNLQFANEAWAEMHGYTVDEILNQPLAIFHTEEQLKNEVTPFNQQAMARGLYEGEVGHVRKDGTTFSTMMTSTVIRDESGNPIGLVGSARDITERKQAEVERERFTTRLSTAADIAEQVGSILDPDELLQAVIPLIKERFGLYYVHVYTLDEEAGVLNLRAGYGEPGRIMVERGHSIPLDREASLVATAARTKEPVLVNDVSQNPNFMPNELLPDTKSEVAVPAIAGGKVLGVFDVQHDEVEYFTDADLDVFTTLAAQIATTFQNAQTVERLNLTQASVDRAGDAVFWIDKDANLAYVNNATCERLGYTREELLGMSVFDIDPVFPQEAWPGHWEELKDKKTMTIETVHEARDGTRYPVEVALNYIEYGDVAYNSAYARDITERQVAERAVREARDRAELYLDVVGSFVVALDTEGKITLANRAACELLGYEEDELVGQDWFTTALPEAVQEEVRGVFAQIMGGDIEAVEEYTSTVVTRDGEERTLAWHNSTLWDDEGNIIGSLSSAEDITERLEAEQELRENQVKFQTVADFTYDWEYWLGPEDEMLYVSPACEKITGYTVDEFMSDPELLDKIVLPEDKELLHEHMHNYHDNPETRDTAKEAAEVDFRIRTKDGEVRWIGHACQAVYGPDGEWLGRRASNRDATESKQAEMERERFTIRLNTAAQISEQVGSILDPDELLKTVIPLIKEQFGIYYVHVYTLDEESGLLNLRAGYGEAGEEMLAEGHSIPLDREASLVATAARTKEPVLVDDVTENPNFMPNPLLPDTKTEVAVPSMAGGRVLGVFDVQHDEANYFTQADLDVFQTLAAQIANAFQSAEAFNAAEQERERAQTYLNVAGSIIVALNTAGNVVLINKAGCDVLGYEEAEILGQNWFEISLPEEVAEGVNEVFQQIIAGDIEQAEYYENEIQTRSGEMRMVAWHNSLITDEAGKITGILSSGEDITERKQAERELNRQVSILENSDDYIAAVDMQGIQTYINQAGARMVGYDDPDDLIGKVIKDMHLPEDTQLVEEEGIPTAMREGVWHGENRLLHRDGTTIPVDQTIFVIRDSEGEPQAIATIMTDTTERKAAEAERERFTTRLDTAAQISEQVGSILDPDELLQTVIPLIKEQFGIYYVHVYTLDEESGMLNLRAGYGEAGEKMLAEGHSIPLDREASLVATAARTKEPVLVDDVTENPNFMPNPLLPDTKTEVAVPSMAGGRVLGVFDVQHDEANYFTQADLDVFQTLAAQIANAFRSAELLTETAAAQVRFQTVADFTYDWEYWLGPDDEFLYVSPACEKITGYTVDEFMSDPALLDKIVVPEDKELLHQHMHNYHDDPETHDKAKEAAEAEFRILTKDGEVRWIGHACQAVYGPDGEWLGRRASNRDATESKQAEMLLAASEEQFHTLFESMTEGVAIHEVLYDEAGKAMDYKILDINTAYTAFTGLSREAAVDAIASELYGVDEPPYLAEYAKVAETGEPYAFEVYFPPMEKHFSINVFSPAKGQFVTVFTDVTEQRRAQEERERFTTRLDTAARISEQVGSILDPDELLKTVIPLIKEQFGIYYVHVYTLDEESGLLNLRAGYGEAGEKMLAEGHSIPLDREASLVATAARTREPVLVDDVTENPNFMPNPLLPDTKTEVAVPSIAGGKVLGVFDVQHDEANYFTQADLDVFQTLAAQIANAFRSAELYEQVERDRTLYDTILTNLPVGVWVADNDFNVLLVNEVQQQMIGREIVDRGGSTHTELYDVIHTDTGEPYDEATLPIARTMSEGGKHMADDLGIRYEDGTVVPVMSTSAPLLDTEGEQIGAIVITTDISEQVAAQDAIRASEERQRTILETTPVGIAITRVSDNTVLYVNPEFTDILGYAEDELLDKAVPDFYYSEAEAQQALELLQAQDGVLEDHEIYAKRADGTSLWLSLSIKPIMYGEQPAMLAAFVDITERRQAEEAIRESEERLSRVVDNMAVMLDVLDENGNILVWNKTCERITGYTADEIVGNPKATELLYPDKDYREAMFKRWAARVGEDFYDWEWDVTCKDGTVKTLSWSNVSNSAPIPGWPSWYTAVDVTDRKRAEQAIREREAQTRALLDAIPDMMFRMDEEGTFLDFKAESESDLAVPPEAFMGKKVGEVLPPALSELTLTHLREVLETGQPVIYEYQTIPMGGETPRDYEARMVTSGEGEILALIRDITERKQAQAEIQRSQRLLQEFMDNFPDLAFAKDMEGHIILANKALYEFFPTPDGELLGKTVYDLVPDDVADDIWDTELKVLETGEVTEFEEVVPQLGELHTKLTTKFPLYDAQGQVIALGGVSIDITDRKRAEVELERFAARLNTAAQISERVGSILDPDELLQTVIPLIKEQFGIYYVHVYTLDEESGLLNLRAGYGEAGEKMLAEGHSIPLDREASLVATAARTKEPVLVDDVTENPNFMPNPLLPDTKTEVAVPSMAGGRVLGVFDVQHDEANYFTQADLDVFQTLAAQIANAFRSASLFGQVEESLAATEARLRVSQALTEAQTEAHVLDAMMQVANFYPEAQILVSLVEDVEGEPVFATVRSELFESGIPPVLQAGMQFTPSDFPLLQHVSADTELVSNDIFDDGRFDPASLALGEQMEVNSFAMLPLVMGGELKGVLTIAAKPVGFFDERKLYLYRSLADQGIVSLQAARLQEAVQESEARFRILYDNSPIGFVLTDFETGEYLQANQSYLDILGYTLDELNELTYWELTPEEYMDTENAQLEAMQEYGRYGPYEKEYIRKDGTRVPTLLNGVVVTDPNTGRKQVWSLVEDITERRAAEEALQESQQKFQTVADFTYDWEYWLGPEDEMLYVSPACEKITGYTVDEFISDPNLLGKIVLPEDRELLNQHIHDYHDNPETRDTAKEAAEVDFRIRTKDGEVRWIGHACQAVYGPDGEWLGRRASNRDATESKQAEMERERFTVRLNTAAQISERVGSILDPDELLQTVIPLIKEQFGIYYVHVYTLDAESGLLNLRAGYGEAGKKMVAEGHSIPLDREASLVATAARTKEPVLVDDVTENPNFMPNPLLPDTKTEIAVPSIAGGEVLGVFDVQHDEAHYFTQADVDVFQTLAAQIANVFRSASLYEQVEESLMRTGTRLRVSQALAEAQTEDEVLDAMVKVADFYPSVLVAVFTFDQEADVLTAVTRRLAAFESGVVPAFPVGTAFTAEQFTLLKLISSTEPFITSDFLADERVDAVSRGLGEKLGLSSVAIIPIVAGSEWLGFIVAEAKEKAVFDEQKLYLYNSLAEQGAEALQAARLRDQLSLTQFSVDHGPAAIYWMRPDASLYDVNETACEMLGYGREELLSIENFTGLDPNFPPEAWAAHWEELKEKKQMTVQTQHRAKDGHLISVEVEVNYLKYGNQEFDCAFARDITDRLAAEQAVRESEERLTLALEAGRVGIWEFWPQRDEVYYNPTWYTMLGYEPYELPQDLSTWGALLHPDDAERANTIVMGSVEVGKDFDVQFRMKTKDGGWRWIQAYGYVTERTPEGAAERVIGTHTDITEQWRAERAMIEERDRAQSYLNLAGTMIVALNAQGEITLINPAGCEILGYSEDELVGQDWFATVLPERMQEEVRGVFQMLMQGEVEPVERYFSPLVTSQGEERMLDWYNTVIRDEEGHVVGTLSSAIDVTERLEAEAEQSRLSAVLEATDDFVGIALPDGEGLYFNRAARSMVGMSLDADPSDYNIAKLSPESELERVTKEVIPTALETGTWTGESTIRALDGREIPVLMTVISLKDDAGNVQYLANVSRDITELHEAEAERARFTTQLSTSADISSQINAILDPDQLLDEVTALLKERFGLYHVQFYTLDNVNEELKLRSSYGTIGALMLRQGHKVPLDHERSLVSRAARVRETVLVNDVGRDPNFLPNPLLPDTRSEVAVPAITSDQVLGVFDIHADEVDFFRGSDLDVFQTLTGQIATALQNALLFEQQRRTQSALRDSAARIRAMFEAITDGITVTNMMGEITELNEAVLRMHQYEEREALLGNSSLELIAPEQRASAAQAMSLTLGADGAGVREYKMLRKDGTVFDGELSTAILRDEEETPTGFVTISRDITERKRAEEQIAVFQALSENAVDAIAMADMEGTLTYANQACYELFGYAYAEREMEGMPLNEAWPDNAQTVLRTQVLPEALEGGGWQGEVQQQRKDGSVFEAALTVFPVVDEASGQILSTAAIIRDITGRIQVEEERQRFTTQLATAADVSTQVSTILETDKLLEVVVSLVSERFDLYHVHVYTVDAETEELVMRVGTGEAGRVMREQGHTIPLDREHSLVARAARVKNPILVNDVMQEPDFLANPLLPDTRSEVAVPMVIADRVLGVFDVQDDEPERFTQGDINVFTTLAGQVAIALENARNFEEIQKTADRLREVDRLKSEFLANMSHELRTPMNSILGYTEVLLMGIDGELDSEMLQDVEAIYENGQHLLRLINDILDLAKIEAGRMTLNMEDVYVDLLLDEVKTSNIGYLHKLKKPVEFIVSAEEDLPLVRADRVRLTQVLNNLVSNAIKFTEKGYISLRAYKETDSSGSQWVCIDVEDTGIGIAKDDLDRIFERFRQVDGSSTRRVEGTGLGLSITRHLVTMHGGKLKVESKLEVGSTFTIKLPVYHPPAEEA